MSLVGSLEDLGLGDILQIIHLSGKSGTLVLRSDQGEGQIVFAGGLLRGAFTKGGPTNLRELLAAGGHLAADALEEAAEEAIQRGVGLDRVLQDRGLLAEASLDRLRRDAIQEAVFEMFTWPSGEFSFEVREVDDSGEDLFASPGVNPQFLALEGSRLADEAADARRGGRLEDALEDPQPAEARRVDEPAECLAVAGAPGDGDEVLSPPPLAATPEPPRELLVGELEEEPRGAVIRQEAAAPPAGPAADPPPQVVIEPRLAVLEWVKSALAREFPRIHVFQRPDLGVQRIRQYLARAQPPLVLLASDLPEDPLTGARGSLDLTRRLKRLAPGMPVLLMAEAGSPRPAPAAAAEGPDAVVEKPGRKRLAGRRAGEGAEDLARALGAALARCRAGAGSSPAQDPARALRQLKEASARIADPASRGDVLRHVLSFAARTFSRVALFMARDDQVLGIAQVGLHRAGGPDDSALHELCLEVRDSAWLRRVFESRRPVRGAPEDAGDQRLAILLGNELPAEAWVAPILSAYRVVAVLYGDNLPDRAPIGDTRALEVVLDSAGMALDRALLETLAES